MMTSTPNENPFLGRTLAAAGDLSVDEQRFLYQTTKDFKAAWISGGNMTPFQIQDPSLNVYLMFLEPSTRTRESFRSAATFHNITLNDFDASTSSFVKKESLVDTIKMLVGYSKRSIFIIRSKMEGVCLALEEQLADYAMRLNRPKPIFLNAGDGRHEHPTQEFLDEFTFLEQNDWSSEELHIALIGDLLHGRTVHSKADGLKVFDNVKVDLVAPPELALPETYKAKMIQNGFVVKEYNSIQEYLQSGNVCSCWYFTRLQLERMGDEIRDREHELRKSVTFQKKFLDKLPLNTKFYHPLPRHRETPVIPTWLDNTPLNGWETQAMNGYFTRAMELALVAGQLGSDFKGQGLPEDRQDDSFVTEIPVTRQTHVEDRFKVGIKPVDNGLVIDHIAKGMQLEEIWDRISKIRNVLKLNVRGSHGVFHCNDATNFKGIMSLPDVMEITPVEIKKLAAVSPGCTINLIENASVKHKYRLKMPPRIYNFDEISCKNDDCITSRKAFQNIPPFFYQTIGDTFTCKYCGKRHQYPDIWDV
jgi:aspartate carbamoyltransferase